MTPGGVSQGLAEWARAPDNTRAATLEGRQGTVRRPVALGILLSLLIVALEVLPDTRSNEAVAIAALDIVQNTAFVWAGVLGAVLRPRTVLGPAMMAVGVTGALGNLVFAETIPAAYTMGLLCIGLFAAPLTHVLLSYPDGRLRARFDRLVVAATYLHLTVVWWLFVLFEEPQAAGCRRCDDDANLLGFFEDGEIYDRLLVVQVALSVVLALLVFGRLGQRWHAASSVGRDLLSPVLVGGLFCAAITLTTAPLAYQTLDASTGAVVLHALWAVAFGAIPVGYALGLVRDAVRRTRLAVLLAELSTSSETEPLTVAIRRALADPTAEVLTSAPGQDAGVSAAHDAPTRARGTTAAGNGSVIVHDPALLQDGELLAGVARAVAFALENRRLEEEVRTRLAEAEAARSRVVAAGDEARRGIERDLHDGLQQTLISLRLTLRLLHEDAHLTAEPAVLLDDAMALAATATDDLRALAQGVYPMVLTAAGLLPALQALADTAPVVVALDLRMSARSTSEAEAAAYFSCKEAVTNVAKHAGTGRCAISGRLSEGTLHLRVLDDGPGNAAAGGGSGIRGLDDRLMAVGGRLTVDSPAGGPTIIGIHIPWPVVPSSTPGIPVGPVDAVAVSLSPAGT